MVLEGNPTVRDIMMRGPVTLGREDTLDLADDIMNRGRIRHLPVLDGERVVGVVSQRDLFRSAFVAALGLRGGQQRALLKSLRVKEMMSEPVVTISPDAAIQEAARLMMEKKIGCLPVVEAERFVGLITETDILRYVASR